MDVANSDTTKMEITRVNEKNFKQSDGIPDLIIVYWIKYV
jgi:hypothetical protein